MRDAKHIHGRALALLIAVAAALAAPGCDVKSPTEPKPPGGGQQYVLDYSVFAAEVDTIFTLRGCDAVACHGGGIRGTFALSPDTDKDVDYDFAQVRLQVYGDDPAASPILMKPLAEQSGGSAHAGATATGFDSPGDPDYQTILSWIEAGEYQ